MISSPLTFSAGSADSATQCLDVTIINDDIFEGDETFTVGLTVATSDVMMGINRTTVTITNKGNVYV